MRNSLQEHFPEHTSVINLRDFDDCRINEYGELALGSIGRGDMAVGVLIGQSVLRLENIAPAQDTRIPSIDRKHLVAVTNLSNPQSEVIMFSNYQAPYGVMSGETQDYILSSAEEFEIGLQTTPALGLDSTVEDRHIGLRFGNLQNYIHFRDLSNSGTTAVALRPSQESSLSCPTRVLIFEGGGHIGTLRGREGRWQQKSDYYLQGTSVSRNTDPATL